MSDTEEKAVESEEEINSEDEYMMKFGGKNGEDDSAPDDEPDEPIDPDDTDKAEVSSSDESLTEYSDEDENIESEETEKTPVKKRRKKKKKVSDSATESEVTESDYTTYGEDIPEITEESDETIIELESPDKYHEIEYIIPEDKHDTENRLTSFELAAVLSARVSLIAKYSKVLTDVGDITNPMDMAMKEIIDGKTIMKIKRVTGKIRDENGILRPCCEIKHVKKMRLP